LLRLTSIANQTGAANNRPLTFTPMKKIKLFDKVSEFEAFVNRTDIEVLQVDIKAVEQSFCFQEGFAAVVFYLELSTKN
jgi:hypothetical protein